MKNLLMLVSMLVLVSCGGAGGKAGGSTPAATAPDPFVENGYACEGVDKRVIGTDYDAKFSFENLAVMYVKSDRRDANGLTLPEDFYLEIAEPPTCVYNNTVANGSKLLLTFTDKPAERCEWFYSDVDHKFEFDRCYGSLTGRLPGELIDLNAVIPLNVDNKNTYTVEIYNASGNFGGSFDVTATLKVIK